MGQWRPIGAGFSVLIASLCSQALPYPTSLNVAPTADVMPAQTVRVEIELDGDPTPFSEDTGLQVYTQFGLTNRLEVGLDIVDVNLDSDWQLNAKWLAVAESDDAPAVAIGLLDMADSGLLSDWYVMLSRDVGDTRAHGGFLHDSTDRGIVGLEYWPTERTGLLADWTTGPGAYLTAGVYRVMGGGFGGFGYWARNNSRGAGDFAGLNLCWEGPW